MSNGDKGNKGKPKEGKNTLQHNEHDEKQLLCVLDSETTLLTLYSFDQLNFFWGLTVFYTMYVTQ